MFMIEMDLTGLWRRNRIRRI